MFILEELLSPIVTPLILIFCLRPRALEIIDFFRNFTVEVVGVGDTCSFAQMDVRQHGHPQVQAEKGGQQLGLLLPSTAPPGRVQKGYLLLSQQATVKVALYWGHTAAEFQPQASWHVVYFWGWCLGTLDK